MPETIGEPPRGQLQGDERQISGRKDHRDDSRRDSPLTHPPEQIEAVHDAFDAGDMVGEVEREVTAEASIRRHGLRVADTGTSSVQGTLPLVPAAYENIRIDIYEHVRRYCAAW